MNLLLTITLPASLRIGKLTNSLRKMNEMRKRRMDLLLRMIREIKVQGRKKLDQKTHWTFCGLLAVIDYGLFACD